MSDSINFDPVHLKQIDYGWKHTNDITNYTCIIVKIETRKSHKQIIVFLLTSYFVNNITTLIYSICTTSCNIINSFFSITKSCTTSGVVCYYLLLLSLYLLYIRCPTSRWCWHIDYFPYSQCLHSSIWHFRCFSLHT